MTTKKLLNVEKRMEAFRFPLTRLLVNLSTRLLVYSFTCLLVTSFTPLHAQVSIGSFDSPAKGALLDLNRGAQGGLLLSNVSLSDLDKIPGGNIFVGISDEQDSNPDLAGMMVYNTNATTGVGIHVWDGEDWIKPCALPQPGPITFSETEICSGNTIIARIDSVSGATNYVWDLPPGLTGTSTDTVITITGTNIGNYLAGSITVRAENSCGGGTRRASAQTVSVFTIPAAPTNPSSGADGMSTTFNATPPADCTIDWYSASAGGDPIPGGSGTLSYSEILTAYPTTYYAESRNTVAGCVSATRLAVTGTVAGCAPLPATPLITSSDVQFVSNNTYTVNGVILSPLVKIVGNKSSFDGTNSGSGYRADYRANGSYGSLFSWCMVAQYADVLCSGEWRVPTRADFCKILNGGDGTNCATINVNATWRTNGGWLLGGLVDSGNSQFYVGQYGFYWSSSPNGTNSAYVGALYFSEGYFSLGGGGNRNVGYSLRCVR